MQRLCRSLAAALLGWALSVTAVMAAEVKVYDIPSGAHPHDVAPAPDGMVWYTAQAQGALGILDPRSGAVRQVPLGKDSAPHGVIVGPDGAAWITDGGQNAILRYDPGTGRIDRWLLPKDAEDANLNTATFDHDGVLWFTGQSGFYGRLEPHSGEMEVFPAPKGTGPYGITTTANGDVFYASLAGSYVGRIDRATGKVTVIVPPEPGQGARRVWGDSKGNLWVSEWNTGRIDCFTPASGAWESWKLPGRDPHAYAIYVDDRDMVWVSDTSANAILAFDPSDHQFTTFAGSAAGANVRQINGRKGEVWAAESGNDRVVRIRP